MKRIMIDVEGLSARPDACLVQVGAVVMQDDDSGRLSLGRTYLMNIDQTTSPGHRDVETIKWWSEQPSRGLVLTGGADAFIVAQDLIGWVQSVGAQEVWARGPQYDICALEHLFRHYGLPSPWKYNQVRDLRTLTALWPNYAATITREKGEQLHHALHDALYQGRVLIEILNQLGEVNL